MKSNSDMNGGSFTYDLDGDADFVVTVNIGEDMWGAPSPMRRERSSTLPNRVNELSSLLAQEVERRASFERSVIRYIKGAKTKLSSSIDPLEILGMASADASADRQTNSEDELLRDVAYYLMCASATNSQDIGDALVTLACYRGVGIRAYSGLKSAIQAIDLLGQKIGLPVGAVEGLIRSNPKSPTSKPGGGDAAARGWRDATKILELYEKAMKGKPKVP